MAVGDACEYRNHFVVAFKRMHVDGAAAAMPGEAGAADKIRNAGFPEYVGQLLARHPQWLDPEEPVEQPIDVGLGGRDAIAIAGKRLQLAFLPLEPTTERMADPCAADSPGAMVRTGQSLIEGWFGIIAIGLGRSRHCRGCCVSASTSTPERWRIAASSAARSAAVATAAKSRSHSAMLKVVWRPPMKRATRMPWLRPSASGSSSSGRRSTS